MNSFSAGMAALSRVLQGKEFLLLSFVFILVSIGGTTFGMCEEILAFCPFLMLFLLKMVLIVYLELPHYIWVQ